jgi:hypothetical protein
MAAKTPVMTRSTAGHVEPGLGVYGGVCAVTDNILSDTAEHLANRNGLKLSIFYFGPSASANDIDNGDTWTSNIQGIKAVAWQGADAADDCCAATLTTAATGVITFQAENANSEGWLWVLHAS